tara:strand:- start:41 stop:205 length:165 start_codon:yes stop_codon:yes gene_type:complete
MNNNEFIRRLNELKLIVEREQTYYDKNEPGDWQYYSAYMFVLNEIDKLLKREGK